MPLFEGRDRARPYEPVDGDTLEAIAARESAPGAELTAADLARFNWGTADPLEVEACMRDHLGCRRRDAENRFVISADDEPRAPLLLPVRFQGPLGAGQHRLRVRRAGTPRQVLGSVSLPGVTFGHDSAFVRPSVLEPLRALEALARAYPEAKIMIFGHTDRTGDALYNKKLSERRAWSVHAFVTNDVEAWETLYGHPKEDWGAPVLREILSALGHDPGPPETSLGPGTRAAMRAFLGLPDGAKVENDAAFRRTLFAAYMSREREVDVPKERFVAPGYMGCGEQNPLDDVDGAHEPNRRVTFFLFHPERVPPLPCQYVELAPCQRQAAQRLPRHRDSYSCSFYDSLERTCPAPGREPLTVHVVLDARDGADAPDCYRLVDADGEHDVALHAREVVPLDAERVALRFEGVDPTRRYSLFHYFTPTARVPLFEARPVGELIGAAPGHDALARLVGALQGPPADAAAAVPASAVGDEPDDEDDFEPLRGLEV